MQTSKDKYVWYFILQEQLHKAWITSRPKHKAFLYYKLRISFPIELQKDGTSSCFLSTERRLSFTFIPSAFMTFVTVGACNPVAVKWMKNHIVLKCQMVRQLGHLTRTCKLWIQTLSGGRGIAQMYPSQASTLNLIRWDVCTKYTSVHNVLFVLWSKYTTKLQLVINHVSSSKRSVLITYTCST